MIQVRLVNVTVVMMRSERLFCITYDFESETDGQVTVRDRDTMEQTRMPISELKAFIENSFNSNWGCIV